MTKLRGESLGIVVVESGWGSMVPTVVLANMHMSGAAARSNQLNIGDQIMAINGTSLVGLPLSSCQNYIKVTTTTPHPTSHLPLTSLRDWRHTFVLFALLLSSVKVF